jgi:Ribosomal protein L14E/L6E/L27E
MVHTLKPGSVVISTAGRDSGKTFMVVRALDDNYVFIVDGVLRRLDKPKKKKIKHLAVTSHTLNGIGDKLNEGKKVFDAEIRSALKNVQEEGAHN